MEKKTLDERYSNEILTDNTRLSKYEQCRDLQISKEQLTQAIGNNLHASIVSEPVVVTAQHVINSISAYLNQSIELLELIDWVNIIWFNDAFEFKEEESESIISVISVIETMDEEDVVITNSQLQEMVKCLSNNTEFELR